MQKLFILLSVFTLTLLAQTTKEHREFASLYKKHHVSGCFILLDYKNNTWITVNGNKTNIKLTPASTFKLFNSLVILESGALKDENEIIPWDKIKRSRDEWNSDQTLKTAFKYSSVWVYQLLARKVGYNTMKSFITKAHYGNEKVSGGIDQFWLNDSLKISPRQQVYFLKSLYENTLPFSTHSMDIVKLISIHKQDSTTIYHGKTGWGYSNNSRSTGWWIGYIETKNNVYFFANCVQTTGKLYPDFAACRISIAEAIMKKLGLLSEGL
ncbi:MAG: class D beta-lactamase [Ignavibacteria bacterium]|nr:class D beta-lactamase [Ignavibacteria bacterium]